jgi:hypothetical protein
MSYWEQPDIEVIPARYNKVKWNAQVVPTVNDLKKRLPEGGYDFFVIQLESGKYLAIHGTGEDAGKVAFGGDTAIGGVDGTYASTIFYGLFFNCCRE